MSGLPQPGTQWGRFGIEEELGGSGSGRVYAAWDPELDRRVGIKVLHPSADHAARERFVRDSRAAAVLRHPRIVTILGTGDIAGLPYVVMDLVAGGDLASEINQGPLTLRRAESVVAQLAGALDRAHRAGLVHGGVTPDDVLCREGSDDVRLTGWGTSSDRELPHFTAPEQLRDGSAVPASDVYALGCVFFECLTGRVPFPGDTVDDVRHGHLEAPRPRITELRPDLPTALDRIAAEAMAVDPVDRYATCRAMADALRIVAETHGPVTADPPVVAPAPPAELPEPEPDPAPTVTTTSVFDPAEDGGEDTTVLPVAPAPDAAGRRRVLDGAAFGLYEDDEPETRAPRVIAVVLGVAVVIVALLVWRAVNTEAELEVPASMASTSTTVLVSAREPTVEDLRLLVPPGVDGCAPPAEQPTDEPARVVLECPGEDGRVVSFLLYGSGDDRDAAFDFLAGLLAVPEEGAGGECALGRPGRHDFLGVDEVGRVACQATAERVDFVWTSAAAPLLATSSGPGSFGDHYRAWAGLVDRTDAAFPLGVERVLLDQLPDALAQDCDRDIDLNATAGGDAAVTCRLERQAAEVASWVQFPSEDAMDAWMQARRAALRDAVFSDRDDACTPEGFGRRDEEPGIDDTTDPATASTTLPPPNAGSVTYELDDGSGEVLCFAGSGGHRSVVSVRDGLRVGSVAVAPTGAPMGELLRWWETVGHLP